jgi:hypothetical protein
LLHDKSCRFSLVSVKKSNLSIWNFNFNDIYLLDAYSKAQRHFANVQMWLSSQLNMALELVK